MHKLSSDRLSRLFNFCSTIKKLSKLRFVNQTFNRAVHTSTAWNAVHSVEFNQYTPGLKLFTRSHEPLLFKFNIRSADADERLVDLLCNVRVIEVCSSFNFSKQIMHNHLFHTMFVSTLSSSYIIFIRLERIHTESINESEPGK
jgi:hypothetical protein